MTAGFAATNHAIARFYGRTRPADMASMLKGWIFFAVLAKIWCRSRIGRWKLVSADKNPKMAAVGFKPGMGTINAGLVGDR